ncbi:SsgA family sporulation/cell division regulator [Streptomyces boncukensis]|uniref:SsgA family sporulation/cell division regulator n=1 Tax=Streptomyces boncukensis TaxID=2711219 RepID=A0A6G4WUK2_9ACTN|nr:SsgA family sporulation/cell division regulator [Streptomyces boncukensis]
MSQVIEHNVKAQLITRPPATRPLAATLHYDPADPLAVRILFPSDISLDGGDVAWTFSRDLLDAGLRGPAGEGDVHVWPCGLEQTVIELHAGEGVAVLEFRSADLWGFLRCAYDAVPVGREDAHLDLEEALAALLGNV